jgi:hypothetical protein
LSRPGTTSDDATADFTNFGRQSGGEGEDVRDLGDFLGVWEFFWVFLRSLEVSSRLFGLSRLLGFDQQFWNLLKTSGTSSRLLEPPQDFWNLLKTSGIPSRLLESPQDFWNPLKTSGIPSRLP